jgi:hypothetical protein
MDAVYLGEEIQSKTDEEADEIMDASRVKCLFT